MAKRKTEDALSGIMAGAQGQDAGEVEIPNYGRIQSTGVGLRESEIELLDKIGEELGGDVSRNALIRHAVRELLTRYLAGGIAAMNLPLEREVKTKLNFD